MKYCKMASESFRGAPGNGARPLIVPTSVKINVNKNKKTSWIALDSIDFVGFHWILWIPLDSIRL